MQALITAQQAAQPQPSPLLAVLESRLAAMAHVHKLLGQSSWLPLDLRLLSTSLLQALERTAPHPVPMHIDGPAVEINSARSLALALILSEWFTNSCKYGAHSMATGQVHVRWHAMNGGGRDATCLEWTESGGPAITATVLPSLGTALVESLATRELGGTCALRFPPTGVSHELIFPCSSRQSS